MKYENLEQCASISEMIYRATQAAANNKVDDQPKFEEQPELKMEFDVSPLIDLSLDTRDEEWFYQLLEGK